MKKRGFLSLISLILAVAMMITALSSCSADNSSLILCNVKLDTSNASRSFDVTRSTLLTNDNMYYNIDFMELGQYASYKVTVKAHFTKTLLEGVEVWENDVEYTKMYIDDTVGNIQTLLEAI